MSDGDGLAGRLTTAGHELLQRVYFEDTDFSGRVYHARYLQFLERGRSDFLRTLGIHHRELAGAGIAFAVRRIEIDFLKPSGIDDVLLIRSRSVDVSGARIKLAQEICRTAETLVNAVVTVVLIGAGQKPVRLPVAIRAALRAGPLPA